MRERSALLNAVAMFAAATFVIVYFNLSIAWYGAAFLAWLVRARSIYQRDRAAPRSAFMPSDVDEKVLRS